MQKDKNTLGWMKPHLQRPEQIQIFHGMHPKDLGVHLVVRRSGPGLCRRKDGRGDEAERCPSPGPGPQKKVGTLPPARQRPGPRA